MQCIYMYVCMYVCLYLFLVIVVEGCDSLINEWKYYETIAYSAYLKRKKCSSSFLEDV